MPARYKAYPEYKDSGVAWFGFMPNYWLQTRLKFLVKVNMGQSPASEDCNQDGLGLPFLQGNAEFTKYYPKPKNYCEIPRKIAEKGELLFSVRAPVGDLNIADQKYGIGRGLCSLLVFEKISHRFLWWLITLVKIELNAISTGTTFEAVSAEQVRDAYCILPPLFEQQGIATFLDHETGKIDALIEKQQQLIKLLQEKRQAVISHAVTKGLNPDAPMKDSGVEWLGQVPAHWNVTALKRLVSIPIIDGPHESPEKYDEGIPFVSAEAIKNGQIDFDKIWGNISEEENARFSKRYAPKKNDILVVKLGATTGAAAIVTTEAKFNIWVPLAAIRLKEQVSPQFVFYTMKSAQIRDAIQISWTYGTQQTLGLKTLGNLQIAVPPEIEQKHIVEFLGKRVPTLEALELKANELINFLQERRTALISAAVTGKIDVRDWRAPAGSTVIPAEAGIHQA